VVNAIERVREAVELVAVRKGVRKDPRVEAADEETIEEPKDDAPPSFTLLTSRIAERTVVPPCSVTRAPGTTTMLRGMSSTLVPVLPRAGVNWRPQVVLAPVVEFPLAAEAGAGPAAAAG